MPPTLLAADIQATWKPVWFLTCAQFPRVYATRDVDIPFLSSGVGFDVGDSDVGSTDVLGGGAGPPWQQAYRGILNTPVITRRLGDPAWPMVDVQDVTVVLLNEDGELTGDWRGAPFTLSAYDAGSSFLLVTWTGLIVHTSEDRGQITITGKNVDLSILEAEIPKGVIDTATFPLAVDDGAVPTWLFGNVTALPLPCVQDDQITSQFDYLLCRGDAAALTGLRRVTPGSPTPFIAMTFDELEPYPGMDGVLVNGDMEDWDAGPTSAPDSWTLSGAGATVAKNITAGAFTEGSASASVTAAAATTNLIQDITFTTPTLPLSWWWNREITVTMDVRASVAGRVHVRVNDTSFHDSTFHTGGGTFETLTVGTVGTPCIIDGAAPAVSIRLRIAAGAATTVEMDNVRVYLRAFSLAECLRPDLYAGYTALRTFLRQEDSSGSLYTLAADVHGLQPERNPVRAIRTLLADPTHGLGKAVDADSFDVGEIAACFTHEAAVLLDGPELFWPVTEAPPLLSSQTMVAHDYSGHERHGVYDKGIGGFIEFTGGGPAGANDGFIDASTNNHWVEWPSNPAYSGQAISLRVCLQIPTGGLPDANPYPILEKLVGTAAQSGYGLYRQSNNLVFFVVAGGTLQAVTSALVDVTDEDRWIDCVGTAATGVLKLYRDGVLVTTGSYTGTIAEGDGVVLLAKWGTGGVTFGEDRYDNVTLYSHALSAPHIAALHAALPLDVEPIVGYDAALLAAGTPTFYYRGMDETGAVVMTDTMGLHHGAWVGSPTFGVAGPLNPVRGYINRGGAVHFANDVANYGIETGMTLADAAGSLVGWYKPTHRTRKAGLVEKTIGSPGVRDTQWGFCQRDAAVRFTLVHAAGTLALDVPLLHEDKQRWTFLAATWASGAVQVYKNGALAGAGTYTAPVASGVGDFYYGVQGSAAAGTRTRPAQGDLGRWSYQPIALTAADIASLWLTATWYNGGLYVDAALQDQRAVRVWLEQLCLLRGIRLGFTTDGTITVSVDAAAATSIRLHARDGAGDGERTLKAIGAVQYPNLDETVGDVVVKGRRDLLSNAWLVKRRRTVHANMGQDRKFELDCVREYPALDRIAVYLAARLLASERTVTVSMGQEARQLMEAELVMVTDAFLGFDAAVMEAKEVRKSLPEHGATVQGWSEAQYDYDPGAFPSGATSG